MYYLYILQSQETKRHYIGITADIQRRFGQHNQGRVRSTKAYVPWKLAYSEEFSDKTSARKREIRLKQHAWMRSELLNNIIDAK